MKQHIFLFQVHKQPELFGRIIKILASPNHHFLVNVDSKVKNLSDFVEAVKGINNVHWVSRRFNVFHGGPCQFICTLYMLREALALPFNIDYFHQISGQDYPLRTNEQFDDFFERTNKSFMRFDPEELREKWMHSKYANRVNNWWPNTDIFFTKVYSHTVMKLFSKIFKRSKINDILGGGVGSLGTETRLNM